MAISKSVVLFFAVALAACSGGVEVVHKTVAEHRAEIDANFKDAEKSPLPKEAIASFTGVKYYAEDAAYKVKAKFKRSTGELPFAFPHTNSKTYVYVKYGELYFSLDNQPCTLSVYQSPELSKQAGYEKYLFIPFTDLTNGTETYAGGRYLEFSIPDKEDVDLDFNFTYTPYCAYNPAFSCPIPPKENNLSVAVKAGEKLYQ